MLDARQARAKRPSRVACERCIGRGSHSGRELRTGREPSRGARPNGRVGWPGVWGFTILALSLGASLSLSESASAQDGPDSSPGPVSDGPPIESESDAEMPSSGAEADAQSGAESELAGYYRILTDERLLSRETGTEIELRDRLRFGEELLSERRWDEAALVFWELVESPRFQDFGESDEVRQAELMLTGALIEMGAFRTAFRVIERVLSRGQGNPYFGPAFRRAVDIALAGADMASILDSLSAIEAASDEPLLPDAKNELRYLRGRSALDSNQLADAEDEFAEITRRSRFYANAAYLRGVIETRRGDLDAAEERFCSIATTPDSARFTFYVDSRYFDIRDLTWLALGRVAHEGTRTEDAFYYYFQVPNDSQRVSEALFEAAWSMYEGGDSETAVDLLDQLVARFPSSPFVDEAQLLRGYVHLARCEFEEADRLFIAFSQRFEPIRDELDRILASASRRARIVEELLAAERATPTPPPAENAVLPEPDVRTALLGLLRVDPSFYRLYQEIRALDAEAARAASVADQVAAIEARLRGSEAPSSAAAESGSVREDANSLERAMAGARAAVRALIEQLDTMRQAGAPSEQLRELESELRTLGERAERIETARREATVIEFGEVEPGRDLAARLRRERVTSYHFPSRVARVREGMSSAANRVAVDALVTLRERLGSSLRRARIGRIDAVMGSKRRVEIQIQSLAAGRFPPELQDPLRIQGLLRDDEEYWPFEGESWVDEYEEDESDEEELE